MPVAVLKSAPAPKDKLHLAAAGTVKVANLTVNDAAVIDENWVVIAGRTGDVEDTDVAMNEGMANGAIIDLTKKSAQPFAGQHATQIWGVSSYGGRLVTSSSRNQDGVLRSWDLKTHESKEVVQLDDASTCRLRGFHKSDRVVVNTTKQLLVFSPSKPQERLKLPCPAGVRFVTMPLAVSPDDAWIACSGDKDQVVCFEVATKKATVVEITPTDAGEKWAVHDLAFSPSGKLFVCRTEGSGVPGNKDVPADRRGLVRIDLPEGKVVPLNMERTASTDGCAFDGKETLLATLGLSQSDKQADQHVAELRLYNLASRKMVYREQLDGGQSWHGFTPSGKRLVCVARDGTVRWWNVSMR